MVKDSKRIKNETQKSWKNVSKIGKKAKKQRKKERETVKKKKGIKGAVFKGKKINVIN